MPLIPLTSPVCRKNTELYCAYDDFLHRRILIFAASSSACIIAYNIAPRNTTCRRDAENTARKLPAASFRHARQMTTGLSTPPSITATMRRVAAIETPMPPTPRTGRIDDICSLLRSSASCRHQCFSDAFPLIYGRRKRLARATASMADIFAHARICL